MPKISKIKRQLPNLGFVELEVFYTQNDHFLIKGLPIDFTSLTMFKTYGYESQIELENALDKAIKYAAELSQKTRKVIGFKISGSSNLVMNRIGDGSWAGHKRGLSGKIYASVGDSDSYAIQIAYHVYLELNDGLKLAYREIFPDGRIQSYPSRIDNDYEIIEWSKQREEFFKDIANQMQNLLLKLSEFFFADKDVLLYAIDHNGFRISIDKE